MYFNSLNMNASFFFLRTILMKIDKKFMVTFKKKIKQNHHNSFTEKYNA